MKAIKIWNGTVDAVDNYVDFIGKFKCKNGKTILRITANGSFAAYVNGTLAGFGDCADFPEYKDYYTFDITEFCQAENELKLTVWHYGADNSVYINDRAFVAFEVQNGENTVLKSDKNILCRDNPSYKSGYKKLLTYQLGFSYLFDGTKSTDTPYEKSTEYGECIASDRKIKNLVLKKRCQSHKIASDISYLYDLGRETVGFLELELTSRIPQTITVAYGEHLRDGHVLRKIGHRDFSAEYVACAGENLFTNHFRRFAGRYIEFFAEDMSAVKIKYAGLRPTDYPLREIKHSFENELDQKIYDTSVRTLKCCMHEHYEDCPWREQALYTMDSRNQMLCGYTAFYGHDFQRHSLELIAKSIRDDGLLCICAPAGSDAPIPFFSMVYPIELFEYINETGDKAILNTVGDTVKKIVSTFKTKIDANGLIPNFPHPYWNFYEWSEDSENWNEPSHLSPDADKYVKRYDLILNCMYVRMMKYYDLLFKTKTDTSAIKNAIKNTLYDKDAGLFRMSDKSAKFNQLGNSLALLIGLGGRELAEKLIACENIIPMTISMRTFFYDALLELDESYSDFVISDIRTRYKKMLDAGATTFWETEGGAASFGWAGSLCHGWSAMPVYYLTKLLGR